MQKGICHSNISNEIYYDIKKTIILYLSREFYRVSWNEHLHRNPKYDVTPTFIDVTAYAISASGYPGTMSSLLLSYPTRLCVTSPAAVF